MTRVLVAFVHVFQIVIMAETSLFDQLSRQQRCCFTSLINIPRRFILRNLRKSRTHSFHYYCNLELLSLMSILPQYSTQTIITFIWIFTVGGSQLPVCVVVLCREEIKGESTLEKTFTVIPLLSNNKEKRGLAVDGRLKDEDTNLASTTM